MSEEALGLFGGKDRPDFTAAWSFFEKGRSFNNQINLDATVKSNENF